MPAAPRKTPLRDALRRRMATRAGLSVPDLPPQSLEVGGRTRTFVEVPGPGPDAPLLLVLHGAGGTGAGMAALTGLHTRGPAAGCAAVFPDGVLHVWNDSRSAPRLKRREGVDDVAFLVALVDRARRSGPSGGRRVFAVGISNGGFLAEHLARYESLELDGIVLVASGATVSSRSACPTPRRPVRVLAFHGTADPLVPYGGGPIGPMRRLAERRAGRPGEPEEPGRGVAAPIEEVCADWARPGSSPVAEQLPPAGGDLAVDRLSWPDPLGTWTTLYRVRGGGHTWPGGAPYLPARIIGPVARTLDATGILLDFVHAHVA
jgi:polyhydroxybutyrate depolymerase